VLSLPMYPQLTQSQVAQVAAAIHDWSGAGQTS
jgi:dTDP-4-amino-4,6-dideoxygalactose transaminase